MLDGPGWWDWVGLIGTLVGFIIAFSQLARTRKAADEATSALRSAQKKLSGDALSAVMPTLRDLLGDLEFAMKTNDNEVAQRALVRFGHSAQEIAALLKNVDQADEDLIQRIKSSGSKALDAKEFLVGKTNPDVTRAVKESLKEIEGLSTELAGIGADIRYSLQEGGNV